MNVKHLFCISLVSLSAFSLSCGSSQAASENREEVVFDDGYKTEKGNEVVITESDLKAVDSQHSSIYQNTESSVSTNGDHSEIVTNFDSYGNKTETRFFKNDSRLNTLLIRTAVNGTKQMYVYGTGGEVKPLPDEMKDRALAASADEIANAAGIYKTRSNEVLQNFRKPSKSLQPLPNSNFPIQTPQNSEPQPETEKQDGERQPDENTSNPAGGEMENR